MSNSIIVVDHFRSAMLSAFIADAFQRNAAVLPRPIKEYFAPVDPLRSIEMVSPLEKIRMNTPIEKGVISAMTCGTNYGSTIAPRNGRKDFGMSRR